MYEFILTELENQIFHIVLNRVDKRNALNQGIMLEIDRALDDAEKAYNNGTARVLFIRAEGRAFSSGIDLMDFDAYIEKVKSAPYINFWDEQMRSYYKADVKKNEDDTLTPIPQSVHMMEAVNGGLGYPWLEYIQNIDKPAILINGPGIYTLDAALLPEENAMETVNMMKDCRYVKVPGNHQTMLYGEGAKEIVAAITSFLKEQ